jgi:hypothetical protein
MSRETEISITSPHFPASKFCIARPARSGSNYNDEFYNVDRNDWSQQGTLWSYKSHVEVVFRALQKAIDLKGQPSLDKNPCPCNGCNQSAN